LKERCQDVQGFNYEPANIKNILERLAILGLGEAYFEDFYDFLNKETELFITNCTNLNEGKDYLSKCLNVERTFQKHFLKNIKTPATE
jgi:hypothetical protein